MDDQAKTGGAGSAWEEDDDVDGDDAPFPRLDPASAAELVAGKYRLLAVLGRGGMADVYLALARGPLGFNKLVVVKKLRAGMATDPSFIHMFLDEARLAARLSHSNIVQTYEVAESGKQLYIAMEYLDGQSLHALWKQIVIEKARADDVLWARIIADALRGLHYAHELRDYDGAPLGVIHRDVSPHNLFVTYEGEVKIVDFGIAKAAINSADTETGVLKGKIGYMAIEQGAGSAVDRRADIYSMGIVLWEMLAGVRLFDGSAIDVLHQMMSGVTRSLAEVRPDIPSALVAIVDKALARAPEDRFQTAEEMRDALEIYIHATGEMVQQGDIAALLAKHFHGFREERQREVRGYMSEAKVPMASGAYERSGEAIALPSKAEGDGTLSGNHRLGGFGPHRSDSTSSPRTPHESGRSPVTEEKRQTARRWAIAAWAIAALTLAIVALVAKGTTSPSADGLVAASTAAPPAVASADLTVRTDPKEAHIFLDGHAMEGNPLSTRLPADGRTHVVRVEAQGFVSSQTPVALWRDSIVDIVLRPETPVAPALASSAPPTPIVAAVAAAPRARAPRPTPAGSAAPPPPSAAPAAPSASSDPKKVPAKPKLDEDPWR